MSKMTQSLRVALLSMLFGLLDVCTGFALHPKARTVPEASSCGTRAVHTCLVGATEMVPDLYFHPLNADLLIDISKNLCGKGLENCMTKVEGNCSKNTLAPFSTVVSTINYVCQSDISNNQACITNPDNQRAFKLCFQLFKVVFDYVINDATLSNQETKAALCRQKLANDDYIIVAYDDVTSCVAEAAEKPCGAAGKSYVENLMTAVSSANREVLQCA